MAEGASTAIAVAGVKAFGDIIVKLGPAVASALGKSFKAVFDKFDATFGPHLQVTFDRCTKIKTILNKDEPVNLLSQYVNLNFKCGNKTYDDYSVIDELRKRKRIIISGTAGGGKTIFMKYLWVSLFENPKGKIPIFIELRKLNEIKSDDLMSYIYHSIVDTRSSITRQVFDQLVSSGAFIFMFDGFDELLIEKRREIEKQILAISTNIANALVVVSGRPDERFDAWQAYSNFAVQPLDKPKVIDLIEKLKYDNREIKKKFIDRVKSDLYERHKSFLSSPLLATMMLITFRDFADIPEKIYLFYDQAFDALFSKHDATKEGYKRKLYTDIPSDEFKKYLSYFCLISYYDEKYEFNEDDLRAYVKKGIKIDNANVPVDDFIRDLLESICILQRDGIQRVFSHRTFQEFFSALCLARFSIRHTKEIILKAAHRPSDGMIQMLFDMNPDLVETQFILPMLGDIIKSIRALPRKFSLFDYLAIFYPEVIVHLMDGQPRMLFIQLREDRQLAKSVIRRIYPKVLPSGILPKYSERDKKAGARFSQERRAAGETGTIHIRLKLRGKSKTNKSDPNVAWLENTGRAAFYRDERAALLKLLPSIEKRRAMRGDTIDDVFGINP